MLVSRVVDGKGSDPKVQHIVMVPVLVEIASTPWEAEDSADFKCFLSVFSAIVRREYDTYR